MDWASFAVGIVAAFVIFTAVALVIAAIAWPGGREEDDLP
jgi:hypothetical protein